MGVEWDSVTDGCSVSPSCRPWSPGNWVGFLIGGRWKVDVVGVGVRPEAL